MPLGRVLGDAETGVGAEHYAQLLLWCVPATPLTATSLLASCEPLNTAHAAAFALESTVLLVLDPL